MARSLLEVSLVFALLSGCDRPAESPRPPAHLDTNVVLVTACGLRCDLLEEACRSGATPALARLRADASFASTVTTPSCDCLAAHASLFLGARRPRHRRPASDVLPRAARRGRRRRARRADGGLPVAMLVDRGDVDGESDSARRARPAAAEVSA